MTSQNRRNLTSIAREVRKLHDIDEQLSRDRQRNLESQRDVRLRIGRLVAQVDQFDRSELARRSGFTAERLRDFERTALAWPEGSFPVGSLFTALEELRNDPDRYSKIQAGMSKRDAREAKGGKSDSPGRWTPQQKLDTFRELMESDPAFVRLIATNSETRAAIARAENDAYREDRDRRDADPNYKTLRQTVSGDDAIRRVVNARYMVSRSLDQLMNDGVTAAKRREFLSAIEDLATTVDWARAWAKDSDTSFEQALEDLLRSQEN